MSDDQRTETDAEWLKRRGWLFIEGVSTCDGPADLWFDSALLAQDNGGLDFPEAVAIQTARDEQEERAAWVAFGAAATRVVGGQMTVMAQEHADEMLKEYRRRFARKVPT